MDIKELILDQKQENRMDSCCLCHRPARHWVREVLFKFSDRSDLGISSANYEGPIPGFCFSCVLDGPGKLAQAVYMDRPEVGLSKPTSWLVTFTDSSTVGGTILSIAPDNLTVEVGESYKPHQPSE